MCQSEKNTYQLGIDIGTSTIKLAVIKNEIFVSGGRQSISHSLQSG